MWITNIVSIFSGQSLRLIGEKVIVAGQFYPRRESWPALSNRAKYIVKFQATDSPRKYRILKSVLCTLKAISPFTKGGTQGGFVSNHPSCDPC